MKRQPPSRLEEVDRLVHPCCPDFSRHPAFCSSTPRILLFNEKPSLKSTAMQERKSRIVAPEFYKKRSCWLHRNSLYAIIHCCQTRPERVIGTDRLVPATKTHWVEKDILYCLGGNMIRWQRHPRSRKGDQIKHTIKGGCRNVPRNVRVEKKRDWMSTLFVEVTGRHADERRRPLNPPQTETMTRRWRGAHFGASWAHAACRLHGPPAVAIPALRMR